MASIEPWRALDLLRSSRSPVDVILRWTDGTGPREKALNLTVLG